MKKFVNNCKYYSKIPKDYAQTADTNNIRNGEWQMNVTDFVNLVINSLKITGKGTGAIKDNEDGSQSAVILTFKEPLQGDVFDFGNGTTSDITDVKPQTKPAPDRTEQQQTPNHIVSMEDLNTNYYENSIKEQAQEEAKNEQQNTGNNSSADSWLGNIVDSLMNFFTSLIEMLFGKAAN